jgi:predicted transcriptional regulator
MRVSRSHYRVRTDLRSALVERGLTVTAAARDAGIAYSTLCNILAGRSGGSMETWRRIKRLMKARAE